MESIDGRALPSNWKSASAVFTTDTMGCPVCACAFAHQRPRERRDESAGAAGHQHPLFG
jgi:hypothetical protein